MMLPQSRLKELRAGKSTGTPLVDLGTSSLTGIRANAAPHLRNGNVVAHPIFQTLPLEPTDCIRLGSDCIRTGLLFDPPQIEDEQFVDAYGVEWLLHQGSPSPLKHPLETAGLADIQHHPKPRWTQQVQTVVSGLSNTHVVIADAPCPGILDLCFLLRNTWQFLDDLATNSCVASALFEWSLETVDGAYEYLLRSLPQQPDIIVYGDDLGYQDGMYLSPLDYQSFVRPHLQTLLAHLRRLTPAAICFHSCGAIRPILPDLADLGIEILNLDTNAKGMSVDGVRRVLPALTVLHGSNNLGALGAALAQRNRAGIALLATELAASAPVIAAPMDNLSTAEDVNAAVRGAAFVRHLSDDDFEQLRHYGPVRSIIESAMEETLSKEFDALEQAYPT